MFDSSHPDFPRFHLDCCLQKQALPGNNSSGRALYLGMLIVRNVHRRCKEPRPRCANNLSPNRMLAGRIARLAHLAGNIS